MADFGPNVTQSPQPDNLWAGTQIAPVVADEVVLKKDETNKVLLRGTVLGRITADGLCVPVDSAGDDGSEEVWAILAEDTNVEEDDTPAPAYLTGEFSEIGVIVLNGTVDDYRVSARERNIFFKPVVPA